MKQGWSVLIEGRPAKPVDPVGLLDELIGLELHPSTSFGDGLLSTRCTVDASSPMEAVDHVYEALAGVLAGNKLEVEHVDAMTETRLVVEIEESNLPDLVGIAEIAELAGTSRQRAFQMTANRGFPVALLELASGRLWSGAAVRSYLEGSAARRGPIVKTLSNQVGGNGIRVNTKRLTESAQRIGVSRRPRAI